MWLYVSHDARRTHSVVNSKRENDVETKIIYMCMYMCACVCVRERERERGGERERGRKREKECVN